MVKKVKIIAKKAWLSRLFAVYYGMNKERKTMNTPLQKFRVLKGKELVDFFMNRFDYTEKQARFLENRMPGGFKVQVI